MIQGRAGWLAACALVLVQIFVLRAELTVTRIDLNDNVSHFTLIERMANAVERGKSPVDFQVPETAFGYPMVRTYQPLAHALVVFVYFLLGKSVSLLTVFVWIRYLALSLLPLSFYFAARKLDFTPEASVAAALLAPLIVTNGLYGLEYGSYVWAGNGLFPQSVAVHFLLLSIGLAYQTIRKGTGYALSGVMLGFTFLAHFVFGYMGGLTVFLMAFAAGSTVALKIRVLRVARIAAFALLPTAFQLLSLWQDGPFINHSRWEPQWKWDSFGIVPAVQQLFTGELLDHGRLPVLSVLALLGLLMLAPRREGGKWYWPQAAAGHRFICWAALLWMLLFAGRPTWGSLLKLFGISADVQIHRFLTGAQLFLVLLSALGLGMLWNWARSRWGIVGALALAALLVTPMALERQRYLENNATWGEANLASYRAESASLDAATAKLKERGGRVFPGLAGSWGSQFKIGYVPVYAFLSVRNIPSVSFLYHSMALTGDVMIRFNEANDAQYRLFNIHSVIADRNPVARFLTPLTPYGRFHVYEAPSSGYFDVVEVPFAASVDKDTFYGLNDRWLQSDLVQKRLHAGLDLSGRFTESFSGVPRIEASAELPPESWPVSAGDVTAESDRDEIYRASITAARPAWVLFRMTYHPNWRALVDGKKAVTAMLSPGFIGVPVPAGKHEILCEYAPGVFRLWLCIGGMLAAFAAVAWERFRRPF